MDPVRKKKICLWLDLSAIIAFIVVGTYIVSAMPMRPDPPPFIIRLLRQNKYPPSILFADDPGSIDSADPIGRKSKGMVCTGAAAGMQLIKPDIRGINGYSISDRQFLP